MAVDNNRALIGGFLMSITKMGRMGVGYRVVYEVKLFDQSFLKCTNF